LEAEITVRKTLHLKCVGGISSHPIFNTGLDLAQRLPAGKELVNNELEDKAVIRLAGSCDQEFTCIEWRLGGSECDVTSNCICGLPLERETESRFENSKGDPLEVGVARTSLKNRARRGEGEEGDGGSE